MNINLQGPINNLGYGVATFNICLALARAGCKVSLFPVLDKLDIDGPERFHQFLSNARFFDKNAPSIKIWHQHDMSCFAGRGKCVGFPIFELDTFTPLEKHHLAIPDRLFVCSDWAKETVEKSNTRVNSTDVIPLGVDTSIFSPGPMNSGPTIFFNIGKWEFRKGHDVLIRAFNEEFGQDENVKLMLCCTNPFLNQHQTAQWTNKISGNKNIHLVPRLKTQNDIADLIRTCDCGVFPARAEGWNLEALETLSCGRHLITTDYSAHKMYANYINSSLITIDELEPAYDNIWGVFRGQGNWAKLGDFQFDTLRQHMRDIHEIKQAGKLELNQAGIDTANRMTWDNTAQKIMEVL